MGGAGYIGSQVNKLLNQSGHQVVILDNLSSGRKESVKWGKLIIADMRDEKTVEEVLKENAIDLVIHMAAFKAAGESVTNPGKYYSNNVSGTISLLNTLVKCNVKMVIFSSTAAVYGNPKYNPIDENHPTVPVNPYGRSKLMIEQVLNDFDIAYGLKSVVFRYFNAAGGDPDSEIGEIPGSGSNLIPAIYDVAMGRKHSIGIFGSDYNTRDGTCIRDYIHVVDLANAHVLAVEYLSQHHNSVCLNLGNGDGYSVLEVLNAARKIIGKVIPSDMLKRRNGDPPVSVADSTLAKKVLGWEPKIKNIKDIVRSGWNWELVYKSTMTE